MAPRFVNRYFSLKKYFRFVFVPLNSTSGISFKIALILGALKSRYSAISLAFFACFLRLFFLKSKRQNGSVGIKLFFYYRIDPALICPGIKNIWNTTASPLANIDQVKHFHKYLIPGIGDTTQAHLLFK